MITSSFHLSLLDSLICSNICIHLVCTIAPSPLYTVSTVDLLQILFLLLSMMLQAIHVLRGGEHTQQSHYIAKAGQLSVKTGRNLLQTIQTKFTFVFESPTNPFTHLSIRSKCNSYINNLLLQNCIMLNGYVTNKHI